jgi:hypothetical protein
MNEEIEDAVDPQVDSPIEHIVEEAQQEADNQDQNLNLEEKSSQTMIPLHVAQKLREQKRELELQLQWEQQERQRIIGMNNNHTPQEEENNSRYESVTREEVRNTQEETLRIVEERLWIKQNLEKYEYVNEHLPKFLKQRPNLASAINLATNRYEEAYALMDALTPKQQQQLRSKPQFKKESPNSPSGVPKAAALNHAVDVMSMSDSEFAAWKQEQKRRR